MKNAQENTGTATFGAGIKEAADLGAEAHGAEIVTIARPAEWPGLPAEIPAMLLRGDTPTIRSVSGLFEDYRLHPRRKNGTAKVQTIASFIDLVNRHKTPHSAVFTDIDWRKPSVTAVIDYHQGELDGGQADFCKHRIHYEFPLSEEWSAWTGMDKERMTQLEFAQFLEDRIAELAAPTKDEKTQLEADFATTCADPAQLVELSRGLQVNVEARVKSAHTLASGEGAIAYEETHQGADGKPLRVPGMFMLSLTPFVGGTKIRTPVRLRYRAANGSINWFYQIYRPDLFIAAAIDDALSTVGRATELPIFAGAPEAS